ncbi:MAG: hypothetical protein E7638_07640 [Ruminococcaceae bacterium]|nr:hypothetical protein [Oscillospiraceae bacterium]
MRRTRKTDPVIYVSAAFIGVLIIAAAVIFSAYLKVSVENRELAEYISENKRDSEEYESAFAEREVLLEEYEKKLGECRNTINALEREAESLRDEAERIAGEMKMLTDEETTGENAAEEYKARLREAESRLADRGALIEHYERLVSVNHGFNSEKIAELYETMEKETPTVTRIFFNDWGGGTSTPTGEKGTVSYYYRDLETGYTIGYDEDMVRYTASLIKAPYVYCILEEIARFEESCERDADGKLTYRPGEEKYDLSRVWTYDSTYMFKEGSGEIQYMGHGTQMTYRELVEYTLLYSDNIAFAELRRVFGVDSFYAKVGELGITGTAGGFMELSAEDCGKFLCAMHEFFEEGSEYALLMKDCMTRSMHNVMIQAGVGGKTAAHKYGWDGGAYHDMAIVYGERPYVLVVMTDLEQGGDEVNAYVRKIVGLTEEIHNTIE